MKESVRILAFATVLVSASASVLAAQFRTYPNTTPSNLLNDSKPRTKTETLPGGAFGFDFNGGYDMSVQVLQMFISPDINGWNWYIPIVLATSPDKDPDNTDAISLARSLSGEGKAALNLTSSYTREWRGKKTLQKDGVPVELKSMSGIWLETGAQYKAHAVTSALNNAVSTKLGHTGGLFISIQGQMTLSDKRTIASMEDLRGVVYGRIYTAAAHWLKEPSNLNQVFTNQAPKSWFGAYQLSGGVFFMDGGALEGSISRAVGTGLKSATGNEFDIQGLVAQAGFRFVPAKLLGQ